jgi:hypothetical protein
MIGFFKCSNIKTGITRSAAKIQYIIRLVFAKGIYVYGYGFS